MEKLATIEREYTITMETGIALKYVGSLCNPKSRANWANFHPPLQYPHHQNLPP